MLAEGLYVDNNEAAWRRYTPRGISYEDYTKPIVDAYARLEAAYQGESSGEGSYDRNDVYRDDFNARARKADGSLDEDGVIEFYSDPLGMFARHRAWEIGSKNCYSHVLREGVALLKNQSEYTQAVNTVRGRCDKRAPVMFDHGCGTGFAGLGFAHFGFVSILCDFPIPSLRLVADLAAENMDNRVALYPPYEGSLPNEVGMLRFDLVVTQDVLEHCINPVATLKDLARVTRVGGLLLMGTFFNSCNGKDPQHLEEHNRFQDFDLWCHEVEACGFKPYAKDKNGVLKLWERV